MLKAFGALPTEERAKRMTDRDYLWCGVNLLLDEEEELARLCPTCREEALEGRCPACGAPVGQLSGGENGSFDQTRYERLRRGEEA